MLCGRRAKVKRKAAIIGSLLLLAGVAAVSCGLQLQGRIVFSAIRDSEYSEIYVMDAGGSNLTRLTFNNAGSMEPRWSPDGRQIAFVSYLDGTTAIYVMNADGSNVVRLTDPEMKASEPAWSPDGKRIAFTSDYGGDRDVCVMDADGGNVVNLTNNYLPDDGSPTWSPDGRRIAFQSDRGRSVGAIVAIYVMGADGSNPVMLQDRRPEDPPTIIDQQPAWSPDGRQIAFLSARSGIHSPGFSVFVMNADGSGARRVTQTPYDYEHPDWSPDGRYIVFVHYGQGIWVVESTGGSPIRLTEGPYDRDPDWSP
jgi:TolB protein